jgi:nucleotide-binding universal stress UspA family protein
MADVEHLVEHVHKTSDIQWDNIPGGMGDLFVGHRPSQDVVRIVTMIGDEILSRAADRAKELGVRTVDTTTGDGDYADEILDMAERAGADMIVIGSRGLGRLRRALLGSVSQKVNQNAECTVVTVR